MTIAEEFKSRNFSIYGQWIGVICIPLCFAVGLANCITFWLPLIPFAIVCLVCSFVILFIEIPLLLRICPMSESFGKFIRYFATNYMRAIIYAAMAAIQWVSIVAAVSSLIAAAVFLTIAALCYLLAGIKGQAFAGSKTLGGQGIAQMIV